MLKAARRRPNQIDGEIHSQLQLEPGPFTVVLFHPDDIDFGLDFAALRRSGASGLWLTRPGELATKDQILRTIASVGAAYQAVTSERPRPTGDVFHLPGGVIAAPFQEQEKAKAVFKGGPLGLEIKGLIESTEEPKGGGLLARFGSSVSKAGAAFAAGASPVGTRGPRLPGRSSREHRPQASRQAARRIRRTRRRLRREPRFYRAVLRGKRLVESAASVAVLPLRGSLPPGASP